MTTAAPSACPPACAVRRCVAMAHVADVDRSADFYALLGFGRRGVVKGHDGVTNWVHLVSGGAAPADEAAGAELMLARAGGPVDHAQQAVLLYMYSDDVTALRAHLLAAGIPDGGRFAPPHNPAHTRAAVFDLTRPFYMPAGELRLHDPDGYCILVGQLG
jgi:hypothetical protein